MHHSVNTDELIAEINSHGHNVLNIYNMKHRTQKSPLPMFYIELQQKENNKDIYSIIYLMHCKIKIEPPHPKREVPQCSNCQRYGHTKNFCYRSSRCVKCAGLHLTKDCGRKEKSKDVKCANCDGNHPASYKGCTVRKEIIQRKFPALRPKPTNITKSTEIKPGVSYAHVVKNTDETEKQHTETSQCQPNNQSETLLAQAISKMEQMMSTFMDNMNIMTKLITTLISKMP